MNTRVKFFTLAALLFSVASSLVYGQVDTTVIGSQKMQKLLNTVFTRSLQSNIPGIVEGTMHHIIVCKKYFPSLNYTSVTEGLTELIQKSEDQKISYEAYLAKQYVSYNSRIAITPVSRPETYDYIFKQIAVELQNKLLEGTVALVQN